MSESERLSGVHDCGGDAAAYVLDALEPAEAERFRRHLQDCAVCRDEVTALKQVVHALPMSAPQHPVPKGLRRRVLRAVREEARLSVPARRRRAPWWLRPRRASRAIAVTGACAAVALAVFGGLQLSSGSGVRVLPARVADISGSASLRLSDGRGELIVRHLSPPPAGKIYELWLKRPRSAPAPTNVLFSVTSTGSGEIGLPPRLHGITEILVTPEPKGGSKVPTHKPVIVASLT